MTDGSTDDYLSPYPCELKSDGWVNAYTGSPLAVRATYWKLYVETPGRGNVRSRLPNYAAIRLRSDSGKRFTVRVLQNIGPPGTA